MSDPIERQNAIDALNIADDKGEIRTMLDVIEVLKSLPSAQPDIVKCKDCVNRDNDWCYYHGITIEVDDYCSYGERLNDE